MQAFDTLKAVLGSREGLPPDQAKVLSTVLFDYVTSDLATRQDVDRVEQRLDGLVTLEKFTSEVTRLDAKIETQGAAVRGEIKDAKLDLIKWIIGALILNFAGSAGLMVTLIHNVKP